MTRLPPRKIIPLIAFGTLMAAAIPVNWSFLQAEAAKLGLIDRDITRIAKGKFTEELTAKYNESSPFRDFGIEAFGSLSYFAFNEARSGAQIGANGVLFSNEEFETGPKTKERIERAVKHIAAVHQALKARGIDLIVAPLPLKADIDRADLGSLKLPAELAGRYDTVPENCVRPACRWHRSARVSWKQMARSAFSSPPTRTGRQMAQRQRHSPSPRRPNRLICLRRRPLR